MPTVIDERVELRPGRELQLRVVEPVGRASGVTVFLVHGAGGRSEQWRFVVPALLKAGDRVVTHDALGHGRSAAPHRWAAYRGSEAAEDLLTLVHRYGGPRNVLVGHSYGCLLTLAALGAGAPAVERAVMLAPPPLAATKRPSWIAYLPVPLLERLRPRLSAGFRAAAWGPDADPALVDEETVVSDRNPLYVFKALWRQRLVVDAGALARLALPVQLLAGEADRLTPPAHAQSIAAALPRAQVTVLPRCGHQILLEQPQAVIDAVLADSAVAVQALT